MKHVNVLIATPGHSLMGAYVRSLLATIAALSEQGITCLWLNQYASHVGDAREVTLSNTRHNDVNESRPVSGAVTYDKIIWIDSDIEWSPGDFMRLYESEYDVISGAYMLDDGSVAAYPRCLAPGLSRDDIVQHTQPFRVHGIGFGFVAVRCGVFEKLSRPWFQSTPVTVRFEDGSEYTFPMMGEDLSWCERVNDLGYEIWVDPLVRVTHHKMMQLRWDGGT